MRAPWRGLSAAKAVGTVACVSLVLAGCGDSDSSDSGASKGSARGDSIVIGTAMPLSGQVVVAPEVKAGMQAAVSAVNAAGGVNGHPLELEVCDTKFDPNTELACMRGLISKKVSAIAGGIIAADQSGRGFQLASKVGIPYIGSYGTVPTEFKTPGVFPLNCGFVGWVYGGTKNLVAQGAKKISVISLNNAPGSYGAKLSGQALAALGMKPAATVLADPQADPTFSTAAAKAAANGVDGIFITLVPPLMPKLLTALRNTGYKGKISALSALATPAILKAAGATADGMFVTGQAAFAADTANPGIKAFLADMKKYQPQGALAEWAVEGWSAVKLFASVMEGKSKGVPTSAEVLAAFNALDKPVDLGSVGPFAKPPAKPYVSDYDRMFSPWVQNGVVKSGVVQPDGKGYVNPFTQTV